MRTYLIITFLFVHAVCIGQAEIVRYAKAHTKEELNVGDRMPDISLGSVINNHTGKTRFSQFKGKLVILDFWSTYCTVCMDLLPHMAKLQQEFGDSIQIFLVDPIETQEQIRQRLQLPGLKKYKFPDLPCIVDAKKLGKLFPTPMGMPHHIWINQAGIIILRGGFPNTYSEKIRDFLAGKKVYSMSDDNSSALFDKRVPYYKIKGLQAPLSFGSYFTPRDNNYAGFGGGTAIEIVDSAAHTIRNTFVNQNLLELYIFAYNFRQLRTSVLQTCVYSPNFFSDLTTDADYYVLNVNDTLRYTNMFLYGQRDKNEYRDKDFIKSVFCYEQLSPINWSQGERRLQMQMDLRGYFGSKYGVDCKVDKKTVPCYIIVRRSDTSTLESKQTDYTERRFEKNGKKWISYSHNDFTYTIYNSLSGQFDSVQQAQHSGLFIFNETGIKSYVDITLPDPSEVKDIEDIRAALLDYGMDIIKSEKEIPVLVLTEKNQKLND